MPLWKMFTNFNVIISVLHAQLNAKVAGIKSTTAPYYSTLFTIHDGSKKDN